MNELEKIDAYFRAANYISLGELYLVDNPLLKRPLKMSDLKKKLVGHWGTVPGQNFIYTHLNYAIKKYDLNMIYICGPGHGGNFFVAQDYLDGTYSEIYPEFTQDASGLKKLFKHFSFPYGIGSHATPEVPGSINEGGELGYSLSHAFGAVLDNPSLIAACVIGDGEAETGPLATSWHGNKFINPKKDGIVLPILHLNGYKISNPTIFSRMTDKSLTYYFAGLGYRPFFVEGSDTFDMHKKMISALDEALMMIKKIKENIAINENIKFYYPMIILRSPKGWTGIKELNGIKIEGTFHAHQIPITPTNEKELKILENWFRSYHPEELFDNNGTLKKEIRDIAPVGIKRMGMNPITNGGLLRHPLELPDIKNYQIEINGHGLVKAQDTLVFSSYLKDVFKYNELNQNFRLFCPDEAMSNRLYDIFKETNRTWQMPQENTDEYLSPTGRIMDSFLSEHLCEGMLEGYILTGRNGIFASYEAFIRVIDSMASQHAKWLKMANEVDFRRPVSSLNILLTSNVWQQDHNGYTHQEPGFLDHLANKNPNFVRLYLPADANSLLVVGDKSLKSTNKINVIVASKHPSYQWLSLDEAITHCTKGLGIWNFASNDKDYTDIVIATCGDTPTIEGLAATSILREYLPKLRIRFINVVDLMRLADSTINSHGISDEEYDLLFTKDKPIIFVYHGYPGLIKNFIFKRHNHNIHVAGYIEEGSITTSFDMRVRNKIDRYHLVMQATKMLPNLGNDGTYLYEIMQEKLVKHTNYIKKNGIDMEEIRDWQWVD